MNEKDVLNLAAGAAQIAAMVRDRFPNLAFPENLAASAAGLAEDVVSYARKRLGEAVKAHEAFTAEPPVKRMAVLMGKVEDESDSPRYWDWCVGGKRLDVVVDQFKGKTVRVTIEDLG